MAREGCAGCFGTGKIDGRTCMYCGGMGHIWVQDKTNYGSNRPYGGGGSQRGPSWADNAFEDNLAVLSFLAVFGYVIYRGFISPDTNWYVTIAIAIVAGYVAYKILKGPLRPLGTLFKYVIYLILFGLFIYGVYVVISMF